MTKKPARARPAAKADLSAAQARRIAIAAQQLASPLPAPVPALNGSPVADRPINMGHLNRTVAAIGLLQIDSVNVLARAHLLPLFSRLGPYSTTLLDRAAWPSRSENRLLVESWAHVASLVPVQAHPLLRWRQDWFANRESPRMDALRERHPGFLDKVVDVLNELGPSSAGEIEKALEAPSHGVTGWWEWSITKTACEFLFLSGVIGVAGRRSFERQYDVMERVLPAAVTQTPTPTEADAKRALTALAARSHGIGTAGDLSDYYRLSVAETRQALLELAEEGEVRAVDVAGWSDTAYLHRDARIPRAVTGAALLCPFDPLIWRRDRTERLFDFHYRIEIYTPEPKRQFGYYVFPLLVADALVGRFDLKADRLGSRLLVQASWSQDGADPALAADAGAVELARMARWLGLDEVVVMPRGDLWRTLASRPGMTVGSLPG